MFESKNKLANHKKGCTKDVVTTKFGDKLITLTKNASGRFVCYCSHAHCLGADKTYKTAESLKKHMKDIGSEWVGPPNPPQSVDFHQV
jgi:hypothetical protein